MAAKKPAARKTTTSKAPAKKAPARKPAAKKAPARKPAAKKPAAKKPVARKAPAKRAAATRKPAAKPVAKAAAAAPTPQKTTAIKEKITKTAMLTEISEAAGVSRAQAGKVLDELTTMIGRHVNKRGLGEFTLPGLFKIVTVKKPARKARKGINPFTGEEQMFKAKPASVQVKVRPLKKLKDMAS